VEASSKKVKKTTSLKISDLVEGIPIDLYERDKLEEFITKESKETV
jgi:hypothetical protein